MPRNILHIEGVPNEVDGGSSGPKVMCWTNFRHDEIKVYFLLVDEWASIALMVLFA